MKQTLIAGLAVILAGAGAVAWHGEYRDGDNSALRAQQITMGKVPSSCYFRGKRLWGKVKVVDSFPDFKVRVVQSFPDLKVKRVTSFPDRCGRWKFVSSFPDFKIKFVTSFPDFTIKYVNSFPGVR